MSWSQGISLGDVLEPGDFEVLTAIFRRNADQRRPGFSTRSDRQSRELQLPVFYARSTVWAKHYPVSAPPFTIRAYPTPNRQAGHCICHIRRTDHLLAKEEPFLLAPRSLQG
jgi:hypothetical protein